MLDNHEIAHHISETGRVVVGGGVTAASTYSIFDLANLSQYASIAAALATMLYFLTMTVIGVLKYKKNKKV